MGRCSAQELRELNQLWGSGRTLTAPATTALHSCLPHFRFPSEAISGHKIYLKSITSCHFVLESAQTANLSHLEIL